MLIDTLLLAASPGELRAARLANDLVWEVISHREDQPSLLGAIHLGQVRRIDAGMNAAFVDIGLQAPGFLRARDVAREAGAGGRIQRLLHEGAAIPVQVTVDAQAGKGPSLTTLLRLPGRRLEYRPAMPGIEFAAELTRAERNQIADVLTPLLAPDEGVVVTTTLLAADAEAIAQEIGELRARWRAIDERRREASPPSCLDPGPKPVHRLLSGHAQDGLRRIIVTGAQTFADARDWCARCQPRLNDVLSQWKEVTPLFETFGVEAAIETALAPRYSLPGGGELVFEAGETLTAIDVNSAGFAGRAGRQALDLNVAAVPDIARQLRLRALGGAIVIDFLRMADAADRHCVVAALRRALKSDPASCHVLGISRLGLVELTRQRRGASLAQRLLEPAPNALARADAVALAALRHLVAQMRTAPAPHLTLAAAPEVIELLRGRLADAYAEACAAVGGTIELAPRSDWPRGRFDVLPSHSDVA